MGGIPDLGAYEADLPESGTVYYVRNTGEDSEGYGLSWEKPFATVRKAVETAAGTKLPNGARPQVWVAAGIYEQDPKNGSQNCFEILEGVNVYGAFPNSGAPGMDERHPFVSKFVYHDGTYNAEDYETILRPKTKDQATTRRVLGQADKYNPINASSISYEYVGANKGDYIKAEEHYEEASGGGYVWSENGGEYVEAVSGIANYVYVNKGTYYQASAGYGTYKHCTASERTAYSNRTGSFLGGYDYEGEKFFVQVGVGLGTHSITQEGNNFSRWYKYTEKDEGEYIEFDDKKEYYRAASNLSTHRKAEESRYYSTSSPDFAAPEICTHILTKPGYNEVGEGKGTHKYVSGGEYIYVGTGKGDYQMAESSNRFGTPTTWDGFTLTNGYINSNEISYLGDSGKRNGGAGALIFTNVTLANSIVTDNINSSTNTNKELRGGGVYCDQGSLVNCYITNNTLGRSSQYTAYGGGGYLYDGTAYNCVVSGNKTVGVHADGGGFFIENGEFFNNTVVGNNTEHTTRGNGGICVYHDDNSDPNGRLL